MRTPSRSERCSGLRSWRNSWWKCRQPLATCLLSWPCKPWGGRQHVLCSSNSSPVQGGIQILDRAEARQGSGCGRPCDHQRHAPAVLRRECGGASDSVLRQSGGSVAFTETVMHSANCEKDRRFARCSSLTGWDTRCCTIDLYLGLTVQKTVEVSQFQFSNKPLTMSSRSWTGAKMQVKVSIGSCAILGENIEARWVLFAWRLAL